ncbi:helix-turn-helix domain-containing protein [Bosea sp. (in: a-proteobacteria)]|uniref:helix-turn-helix domain-containing protein n=1 Tax=Bosea sp. (in: a-proteobacteria) TaxID=1871050 RepID=UPI0027371040|nr:XRE family transcriptional regulator [Bosea sp. (in: a-proteobacteria)]MDP3407742.1 XRE family transcriptional regulator [Bosea sp. (in: a-proteobacteria)]
MSSPAATPSAPQVDEEIGAGLRRLRRERSLSLVDLAARTNLSIGFLSQIERGKSSPTLRALASMADALGVGIGDLFPQTGVVGDQTATIVRGGARSALQLWRSGIRKQLLTPHTEGSKLSLYLVEMERGASTGDELYTHGGEEAGLVMSGAMALRVESESWTLLEGDSFRFLSSRPHRFSNAADGETRVLWVNCL